MEPATGVDPDRPIGFGNLARKEDARFIRGRGNYVDDIQLPEMLYGAVLRSPFAHARIVSIDTTAAVQHPKVHAVLTGADLQARGLAWMPTISGDMQAVLAIDKVRFQGQEVAFVVADDRYSARDALELIDVEYEPLPVVVDVQRALADDAPVIRDDQPGRRDNHIFDWEAGDRAATDRVFAGADVVVAQEMVFPRSHPAPMETCGAIAAYDRIAEKLTIYATTQAPHAHRTLYARLTGLPEHRIRVVSPDVGGGFGNKVPVYPGYVCAIAAAIMTERPVKWMEDRSENLVAGSFARDYVMRGEIAATGDGRILGVRVVTLADHGAFNATAQPTQYPAGFFSVFTGSYDIEAAHCRVTGVYTNKAPGGVAYACSFRIAEAVYLVERLVDCLAQELGVDSAGLRLDNLIASDLFPYESKTGWVYDSGDYPRALRKALELAGYDELRTEQAAKRARGELMGIGLSFFTEAVGAGPRKHMDILGLGMNDGATLRISPTGTAQLAISVQSQGQGHETTFAQIVGHELGIPPEDIDVVHGDTDATPYGLGTYGSRSTPVSGAAAALVARKVRDRARLVASALLEVAPEDLEWENDPAHPARWFVKGDPEQGLTIQELAGAARGTVELPVGIESGLDAEVVYDPPNLTFPFGAYLCVVDVDPLTAKVTRPSLHRGRRLRSADQPDDRRGSDPRWPDRWRRDRADGDDRVRRRGQLPRRVADGLPDPDRRRGARLGDGVNGDAVAAPSARRQGRRRVGDGRLAAGDRQRRGRRVGALRRPARRHALHPVAGVGGDAGRPALRAPSRKSITHRDLDAGVDAELAC